jgi:hypothetical protein
MQNTLENFVVEGAKYMAQSNGADWNEMACERNLRGWVDTILKSGGDITSISSGLWTVSRESDEDSSEWSLERKFIWANLSDGSDYEIHQYPH